MRTPPDNNKAEMTSNSSLPLIDSHISFAHLPGALPDKFWENIVFSSETGLWFMGEMIEAYTVYDLLGWVMSVTATPVPPPGLAVTEQTFYLPYLALFARWCILLAETCVTDRNPNVKGTDKIKNRKAVPAMVTVVYVEAQDISQLRPPSAGAQPAYPVLLLGSTLGLISIRDPWVAPSRKRKLKRYYYFPDEAQTKNEVMNYGECAETLSWLWLARVTGRRKE